MIKFSSDKSSSVPIGADNKPTYAFEHVAAKLEPFDLAAMQRNAGTTASSTREKLLNQLVGLRDVNSRIPVLRKLMSPEKREHALSPIIGTNGLVFPYNPNISEGIGVNYDAVELTHANESFHAYRNTSNVRITISNAIWTCDTWSNALYAMAALHFFRSYSQMDFGLGRTGRPPSPMWFSAYGNYAFNRVPVLMEKADWTFQNDVDYVGIPEFGSPEYNQRKLKFRKNSDTLYTWLPMKLEISSISLVVQHSPSYWTNWNLDDYRSGAMVQSGNSSFHTNRRSK